MPDAFREYLIVKNKEILEGCKEHIGEMYKENVNKRLSLAGNFTIEQLEAIIFHWKLVKQNKLTDFRK